VRQSFDCSSSPEVTVEANPGTVDAAGLGALLSVGVTRLSLGVQSLDDRVLRLLGRIHAADDSRRSMHDARCAGFASVSVDLMFGVPGQTLSHHLQQLQRLLDLTPDHVSAYALSLTPHAPLRQAGFLPAPDDLQADMMEAGRALLEEAGLPQYEVSSFAPPRHRSVHNGLCWAGWPYLGLGASAHSMSFCSARTVRVANPPLPDYLAPTDAHRHPTSAVPAVRGAFIEEVTEPESRSEVLLLGLRTTIGVDRDFYRRRFGADPLEHRGSELRMLQDRGLLRITPSHISPTTEGIWFADELAVRLMA
jgi:oxygen-independent coproporphyrinogen-3 oxidase